MKLITIKINIAWAKSTKNLAKIFIPNQTDGYTWIYADAGPGSSHTTSWKWQVSVI